MDVASIASALVGAQASQTQTSLAAEMLRMNTQNANAIVQVLQESQKNLQSLANVAAGVGQNVNISA
jgi:hypothetical protein